MRIDPIPKLGESRNALNPPGYPDSAKQLFAPAGRVIIDLPATQTETRSAPRWNTASHLARSSWRRDSPEGSRSRKWNSVPDLAAEVDRDSTGPLRRCGSNSTAPPAVSRDRPT